MVTVSQTGGTQVKNAEPLRHTWPGHVPHVQITGRFSGNLGPTAGPGL